MKHIHKQKQYQNSACTRLLGPQFRLYGNHKHLEVRDYSPQEYISVAEWENCFQFG